MQIKPDIIAPDTMRPYRLDPSLNKGKKEVILIDKNQKRNLHLNVYDELK